MAPAKTGKDKTNKKTVTNIDQINKLILSRDKLTLRRFLTVHIKLIAPKIDLIPAQCNLKITKSTLEPEWPIVLKGGYKVQLVPLPKSTSIENINKIKAVGNNQNLRLFNRGNLISGAPNIKGNIQLPNPPIIVGITIKKIITIA